mgnify:CR=1 FL=1
MTTKSLSPITVSQEEIEGIAADVIKAANTVQVIHLMVYGANMTISDPNTRRERENFNDALNRCAPEGYRQVIQRLTENEIKTFRDQIGMAIYRQRLTHYVGSGKK